MVNKKFIVGIILFLAFSLGRLEASDWQKIVGLKGTWNFSIGDNRDWALPSANIDDWHKVNVPERWEKYYEGYNGYAWYRKSFDIKEDFEDKDLFLFLGFIDDVDEVFINGVKIGQTGSFMPDYQTAYNVERKYTIPKNILNPTQNSIAVRVYDEGKEGGIIRGDKIGIYSDHNEFLFEYKLSGTWKFTTKKLNNIHSIEMDESLMDDISVPGNWESQGYPDYDGYAWYRKKFSLPDGVSYSNLYLILGQIDDTETVYLNGKQIGKTKDLEDYEKVGFNGAFRLYRSYKIPEYLLQKQNLISIEVYDKYGEGGIYSGTIGIMTEENKNIFLSNNKVENGFNSFLDVLKFLFNWGE